MRNATPRAIRPVSIEFLIKIADIDLFQACLLKSPPHDAFMLRGNGTTFPNQVRIYSVR